MRASRLLYAALMLLVIITATVAYYRLRPPEHWIVAPNDGCQLGEGPCRAALPDGRSFQLAVTPIPVPVLEPATFQIRSDTLEIVAATLQITGVEVDMGVKRLVLEPEGAGRFAAATSLGLCSRAEMTWHLLVQLELASGDQITTRFPMHTRFKARSVLIGG